jgi:hypothetical protein
LASLGESPNAAFERIGKARGCPVPDTAEQKEWVLRFVQRHLSGEGGKTLVLSTWSLPAAQSLAAAARQAGWHAFAFDDLPDRMPGSRIVYWGGADFALKAAARFRLDLLEPPLDILARLPAALLLREVAFARFQDLCRLKRPTFVKPADPLDKCFDAGTYTDPRDIRAPRGIALETPARSAGDAPISRAPCGHPAAYHLNISCPKLASS